MVENKRGERGAYHRLGLPEMPTRWRHVPVMTVDGNAGLLRARGQHDDVQRDAGMPKGTEPRPRASGDGGCGQTDAPRAPATSESNPGAVLCEKQQGKGSGGCAGLRGRERSTNGRRGPMISPEYCSDWQRRRRTPVRHRGGLAARNKGVAEGKGGGDPGLYRRGNGSSNRGFNGEKSPAKSTGRTKTMNC